MGEREQREHWHLRALEAEALAEERDREIGRQKALTEATQLECNRLADDMKRAEAELRLKEADYRVLEDKVCDFEARLAKVVEVLDALVFKGHLDPESYAAKTLRYALAAAQPEEPKPEFDCAHEPGECLGHCPRCGLEFEEGITHECPPGFQDAAQPEEESR